MSRLADLALGARPEGRTALAARWVVGHADGGHADGGHPAGGHRLIENGEVVIERDRVIHAGSRFPGDVARRIDLGQALIGPGFVDLDALSDLDTTVLAHDNQPAWKKGRVWPRSYVDRGPYEMYSADELAFQKRFAFAQLLMNGITTALPIASLFYREWGETADEFAAAAEAAGALGLRVYLGPAYRSGGMVVEGEGRLEPVFDEARGLTGLDAAIRFHRDHDGSHDGLVRGMLAPDRVETCTAALLTRTAAAARELDCPVRLHCCQGAMEVETLRRLHDRTAPEWLESLGLLSDRLLAPHASHATGDDLRRFREHGVTIVHCPLVAARHGGALRSFARCREMGIRIGLGTDTAPPDMVLNMAVGLMACRIVEGDATACGSADLYDAATLGGAGALGRTDLGRLAPGAKADIAIFDLADVRIAPSIDPIQTLLVGATGRVTRAVFVDGRLSMRDGEVAGMDMEAARTRAQAQFDRLVARYPERSWGHPPVSELFPPSYPLMTGGHDDA